MKVLLFIDWFVPGYKAGGQIQSCVNLTKALSDKVQFYIVTSDRDLGDEQPYPDIVTGQWTTYQDSIKILYLSPALLQYGNMKSVIEEVKAETIYLNSMFSYHFTIKVLFICYLNKHIQSKLVLAPRGMLHPGALQFKKAKKQVFLALFRMLGWHRRITFHATDVIEIDNIKEAFGKNTRVKHVDDFPATDQRALQVIDKRPGELSCLFVSRVAPKKNLLYLLQRLKDVKGKAQLSIVGPIEETEYWNKCQQIIRELPTNITVSYLGPVENAGLAAIYKQHHLFILPTFGENFGHVIFDSFLHGRPVLISDQTPWKELAHQEAGWELPLKDEKRFCDLLETAIGWDQQEFERHCNGAWQMAHRYITHSGLQNKYLQLFN